MKLSDLKFWLLKGKNKTPASPNVLTQKRQPPPEVQRVTHVPLIILLILGGIIISGVGMTAYSKAVSLQKPEKEPISKSKSQPPASAPDWFEQKQQEGIITATSEESTLTTPETLDLTQTNQASLNAPQGAMTQPPPLTPYQQAQLQAWQQREQEKQQLAQQRRATLQSALHADTTVYSNHPNATQRPPAPTLHAGVKQSALDSPIQVSAQPEPENYLMHTRVQAASPYELKAGTVIPSIMLGGVNSDLPGQIMAQVSQNVYDTATGQYLLIPQGTKLVGSYDHQVVSGQKRVLVIWNRLIYPDASSITLAGMPGADQSGYAGFKDKTHTHFWPTFRNALMLSAITAGVQLSQPRPQQGDYAYSGQQVIAGSLGMQMNQLGSATIARNLHQAPTITIRPGYVFNVMTNKDMILAPWQGAMAYQGGW